MRLLIIGQLNGQLAAASKMAMNSGATVTHVETPPKALDHLRQRGADLVMIDVVCDIGNFITQLRSERIATDVIACGIGTDARAAVEAIRAGAREYIPLPPDADLICAVLESITSDQQQAVFHDPRMNHVLRLIDQVAPSDASILITGESGTGKEVIAKMIHSKSNRSGKAFVAVNCAAIPENLLESELFGHEKGSFTGAIARRLGKFEEAHEGTLLLDEISEMDIRLQAKLLRAIQERKIDRVGGTAPVPVNIRILATSNRNLSEEVKQGRFREDLLFRLNVVNIQLPPLRERPEDIRALSSFFARQYAEENNSPSRPIDDDAMRILLDHNWPGNVRELENTIHRSVLLATGDKICKNAIIFPNTETSTTLSPDVSDSLDQTKTDGSDSPEKGHGTEDLVGKSVAEVEQYLILDTLKHCYGNRTHAANILGISIRTLRNKLNEYATHGIAIPPAKSADKMTG